MLFEMGLLGVRAVRGLTFYQLRIIGESDGVARAWGDGEDMGRHTLVQYHIRVT